MKRYSILSLIVLAAMLGVAAMGVAQDTAPAPPPNKAGVTSDAEIESNVLRALANEPTLANQAISASTIYGTVTLAGTVSDDASKQLAATVVAKAAGVKKVENQLTIGAAVDANAVPADGNAPPPGMDNTQPPAGSEPVQDANSNTQPMPQNGPPQAGAPGAPPVADNTQQPPPPPQPRPMYRQPYGYPPNSPNPPNGYPNQYPNQPPQGYSQQQPQAPQYPNQAAGQAVTVPVGANLRVRISQGMDSKHTKTGAAFTGVVLNDVSIAGGTVAIPRGATVQGTVVEAKPTGGLAGHGVLSLQLTNVSLGAQSFPVATNAWTSEGPGKGAQTANNVVGLGVLGAVIGGIAGGGPGAAIGAVAGAGTGVAASEASSGRQAYLPAEAILNFQLAQPAAITTVSTAELQRLASSVPPPQGRPAYPSNQQRGYYGGYPPPPPYYYGR